MSYITVLPDTKMFLTSRSFGLLVFADDVLESSFVAILDNQETLRDQRLSDVYLGVNVMQSGFWQVVGFAIVALNVDLDLAVQNVIGQSTKSFILVIGVWWQLTESQNVFNSEWLWRADGWWNGSNTGEWNGL